MKKNGLFTILCIIFFAGSSQTTVTLTQVQDVFVDQNRPTENLSKVSEINAYTWTLGSKRVSARTYIRFDMSGVPSTAIIVNAKLYLYSHPSPVYATGNGTGNTGANALHVQRVTTVWTDSTTSWNSMPATTASGQLSVPASTSPLDDYVIDVTTLVQQMTDSNYGFCIKLQTEVPYALVSWASSEYTAAGKRPRLELTYTISTGIADETNGQPLLSPNPVTEGLHIERIQDIKSVKVTDLRGRFHYTPEMADSFISRSSFGEAGIYFVEITSGDKIWIRKILVK